MKLMVDYSIPTQALCLAIHEGIGGGIQYWAELQYARLPGGEEPLSERSIGGVVLCEVIDRSTGKHYSLCHKWFKALRLMAQLYPHSFAELVAGTGNASTGDVLIQLAAFGRVRFTRDPSRR